MTNVSLTVSGAADLVKTPREFVATGIFEGKPATFPFWESVPSIAPGVAAKLDIEAAPGGANSTHNFVLNTKFSGNSRFKMLEWGLGWEAQTHMTPFIEPFIGTSLSIRHLMWPGANDETDMEHTLGLKLQAGANFFITPNVAVSAFFGHTIGLVTVDSKQSAKFNLQWLPEIIGIGLKYDFGEGDPVMQEHLYGTSFLELQAVEREALLVKKLSSAFNIGDITKELDKKDPTRNHTWPVLYNYFKWCANDSGFNNNEIPVLSYYIDHLVGSADSIMEHDRGDLKDRAAKVEREGIAAVATAYSNALTRLSSELDKYATTESDKDPQLSVVRDVAEQASKAYVHLLKLPYYDQATQAGWKTKLDEIQRKVALLKS